MRSSEQTYGRENINDNTIQSRQIIVDGYTHGYWQTPAEQAAQNVYAMYDAAGMINRALPPIITVISADTIPQLEQFAEITAPKGSKLHPPITPSEIDKINVETFTILPGGKLQVLSPQIEVESNPTLHNHVVKGNAYRFDPETGEFNTRTTWQRRVSADGSVEKIHSKEK